MEQTALPTPEQVLTLGVVSFDAESDNRGECAIIAEGQHLLQGGAGRKAWTERDGGW